jgi:hypothetical protein
MDVGRAADTLDDHIQLDETEISTFGGLTNFTDERLLPDREFARSEDHDSNGI